MKIFRSLIKDLPVTGEFNDLIVDCDKLGIVVAPTVPFDQVLSVGDRGNCVNVIIQYVVV